MWVVGATLEFVRIRVKWADSEQEITQTGKMHRERNTLLFIPYQIKRTIFFLEYFVCAKWNSGSVDNSLSKIWNFA